MPSLLRSCKEEREIRWSAIVESALPRPELLVGCGSDSTAITYAHRVLDDADIYLVFTEGETPLTADLRFDQSGILRQWNGYTGEVTESNATAEGGYTVKHVTLAPWESRIYSIERRKQTYNAQIPSKGVSIKLK